jgi:hypothetical protein
LNCHGNGLVHDADRAGGHSIVRVSGATMSFRIGHKPLSAAGRDWLAAIADPRAARRPRRKALSSAEFEALLEAAAAHGVLPAAIRYFRASAPAAGTVIAEASAAQFAEAKLDELESKLIFLTGQNLLLAHHAARIMQALAAAKLPAAIIKGPVFARRLYPRPSDRNFTDIDIMAEPGALAAIGEVMQHLGFALANNGAGGHQAEFKWLLIENPSVMVEVQTDLIHSERLARGVRFGYAELMEAGDGDPENPTALLMIAAIHGAAGHQFERLQPVVDVLQAARGAAGAIDLTRLQRSAAATGTTVALHAALDLAARLFDDDDVRAIADRLRPAPWRRMRQILLSPSVVLNAQSVAAGRDSWRRRALREIILHSGRIETARGT